MLPRTRGPVPRPLPGALPDPGNGDRRGHDERTDAGTSPATGPPPHRQLHPLHLPHTVVAGRGRSLPYQLTCRVLRIAGPGARLRQPVEILTAGSELGVQLIDPVTYRH
ncbi:hypothetical protein ACQP00_21205 [Dactylosporangium sp. CS-047395]|uniref:hypothetical protein n=1 Tax=Dactylosporangium sp. CS-047395 TaxID=3239936 RepID=UPI003D8F76A9